MMDTVVHKSLSFIQGMSFIGVFWFSFIPRPSLFCSTGCIASPARRRKGLETLAQFLCAPGM